MAAIAQGPVIRHLPSRPVVYQMSSNYFDLLPDLVWGAEEEGVGSTVDILPICVPQFEPQYYAAASGALVSTADLRGPQNESLHLCAAMADLRAVVNVIKEGRPLPPAPDLDDLLSRAVQLRGRPENAEEWARQLAADITELVD